MNKFIQNMNIDALANQINLQQKSFLTLLTLSDLQIDGLLQLGHKLKTEKKRSAYLSGKSIALIFEKNSTRTRAAFELGAQQMGAITSYFGPTGSHIGNKESVADTARVLGGMYDAIQYRGHGQEVVDKLAAYSGVPIFNGLTDEFHPTQILADFMTMQEHCNKPLSEQSLVYCGDGANNMGNSLMVGCAKMGIDFRMAAPAHLRPETSLVDKCQELAQESRAKIQFFDDPKEAVRDADFIYTDVWLSMGQSKDLWQSRCQELLPYRVDQALMTASQNSETKFLQCLPAFHDDQTEMGKQFLEDYELMGMEVSHDVFESKQSVVFSQSANRLHSIKAIMLAVLFEG